MDHSTVLRESLRFDHHCTGSKGGYGSATNIQLLSKNLDCQSNGGFNTEENIVNLIKDVESNTVSISFDQPNIYQNTEENNLENILSYISNETWKIKWKQKISQRYRLSHLTKKIEVIDRGFNDLQTKVDLNQFEETINLCDTPIEFMNHSAALRENLGFNQHCT
jgi:hypothetical protein